MTNPTADVTLSSVLSGAVHARQKDHHYRAHLPGVPWLAELDRVPEANRAGMALRLDLTDMEELHKVRSRDVNLFYEPRHGLQQGSDDLGRPIRRGRRNQGSERRQETGDGCSRASSADDSATFPGERDLYADALDGRTTTTGFGYFATTSSTRTATVAIVGVHSANVQGERIVDLQWQFDRKVRSSTGIRGSITTPR